MSREREREEEDRPVGHDDIRGMEVESKLDINTTFRRVESGQSVLLSVTLVCKGHGHAHRPTCTAASRCGCGLAGLPPRLCPCWSHPGADCPVICTQTVKPSPSSLSNRGPPIHEATMAGRV